LFIRATTIGGHHEAVELFCGSRVVVGYWPLFEGAFPGSSFAENWVCKSVHHPDGS
jgi:hypothetical protein